MTPEYPDGIYAYFVTINAAGQAAYPYIIGPQYYGVVDTANLGGAITVPSDVTYYVAPEPGAAATCGIFLACGLLRRGRTRR